MAMSNQAKKQVFLRVVSAPDPPPLKVLADAFDVPVRTLKDWRTKQRRAAQSVRDDSAHMLRILDRA